MGELPISVQEAVRTALEAMQADPIHDLAWPYRKQLYAALQSQPEGQTASGWLVLLAAERVFPIAEAAARGEWGEEDSKHSILDLCCWLDMARDILVGAIEPIFGGSESSEAHYFVGNIGQHSDLPKHGLYAFCAAQHMLHEVSGGDPAFYVGLAVWGSPFDAAGNLAFDEWEQGTDAAGSAAWAWADLSPGQERSPAKLQAFWEWWLRDAVPSAWHLAHHPPAPTGQVYLCLQCRGGDRTEPCDEGYCQWHLWMKRR